MEMKKVVSSNIAAVGFDNGTLAVQFKGGGVFHYSNVPQEQYDALLKADSVGSYLHHHIKGKFNHKRVG